MKIQIASDLHLECLAIKEQEPFCKKLQSDADVLVLAGDICSRNKIVDTLKIFSGMYENIIYVNGNHELYGTHIDVIRNLRNYIPPNVHWLDNSEVTLNNQKFIGCTLWFRNTPENYKYEYGMNDLLNFKFSRLCV